MTYQTERWYVQAQQKDGLWFTMGSLGLPQSPTRDQALSYAHYLEVQYGLVVRVVNYPGQRPS